VLENGRVASKPEAARWAMQTLGEPWHSLISTAAAWNLAMEFNKLDETMAFLQFTLENCLRVL
jgi:hypothetical protein